MTNVVRDPFPDELSPPSSVIETESELLEKLFITSDVEAVLRDFAFAKVNPQGDLTSEDDLSRVLKEFSDRLVVQSVGDGLIDSERIRRGFELIVSKMNNIAIEKIGDGRSKMEVVLSLVMRRPQPKPDDLPKAVVGFTEAEWHGQFSLQPQGTPPALVRSAVQDEVFAIFYGHALSPFSRVQDVYSWE